MPLRNLLNFELNLEIFALPESPAAPATELCDDIDVVWTPVVHDDLSSACERLGQLQIVRSNVDTLEARKLDLQRREEAIETIRRRLTAEPDPSA